MADVVVLGAGRLEIPTGEEEDGKLVVNVHELPRIAVLSSGIVAFEDEEGIHVTQIGREWDVVITNAEYSITNPGMVQTSEPQKFTCDTCKDGLLLPDMKLNTCPKCFRTTRGVQRG